MKTWQKVALGVGIFLACSCILLLIIGGVLGYYGYQKGKSAYETLTKPEAKLANAKGICDFTLPEGYEVVMATPSIADTKMAVITHNASQQMILLMKFPNYSEFSVKEFKNELGKSSKEKLLQKINQGSTNLSVKEIKEVRTLSINTHEIPYCNAVFERKSSGRLSDGIIAAFECPVSGKNFLIMAEADQGKYNEKITMDFLNSLKCH